MSNFPNAQKVYDLAAVFRKRVIEQGHSFLWPDQEIWTKENVSKLLEAENGLRVDGKYPTLSHLYELMAGLPMPLRMMAADTQAVCHLFWGSTEATFVRLMDGFLNIEAMPTPDQSTFEMLKQQATNEVPGSWTIYKSVGVQWHVTALMTLKVFCELKGKNPDVGIMERALRLEADEHVWLHHTWAIAHILYPEEFVSLPVEDLRNKVIRRYGEEAGINLADGEFKNLKQIRDHLSARSAHPWFDFFDAEFFLEWQRSKRHIRKWYEYRRGGPDQIIPIEMRSADSPTETDYSSVTPNIPYQVAGIFRENVLSRQKSLLWPEESLWSLDNIDAFMTGFREMPVNKGDSWLQVYENKFGSDSGDSYRILADSYALLMQFPSLDTFTGATKVKTLEKFLGWGSKLPPDQVNLQLVEDGFGKGIGGAGSYFSTAIQYQLAYVVLFAKQFVINPGIDLEKAASASMKEASEIYEFNKSVAPGRHILLHLFAPESFERISSNAQKELIVERFAPQLDLDWSDEHETSVDQKIREIRGNLENHFFSSGFDFYDEDVKPFWQGDALLGEKLPVRGQTIADSNVPISPTITDLSTATHLPESKLLEIKSLLTHKKQLIFEGPPGSGKTFVADKFARYFTKTPLIGDDDEQRVEIIQFHQSYSYEDFVEGIRPETKDGQIHYDIKPGVFLKACARAAEAAEAAKAAGDEDPPTFVLIIDEINRGNVSRILGELMLLLEYRDKSATLQYSQQPLKIPENLYIIGTMNSADRSLSQIDYALRRRFNFVRFMSVENGEASVLRSWLEATRTPQAGIDQIVAMFESLNNSLAKELKTDDLQVGHSYFMRPDIHREEIRQQVVTYGVIPLLQEYFYHSPQRDVLMKEFRRMLGYSTLVSELEPDQHAVEDIDPSSEVEA